MLSGYPPGVSGNEYAIAGPDSETEMPSEVCDKCGVTGMTLVTYRYDAWLACDCGADRDYNPEDTRDPDTRDR
jgi:hypothetical protein